MAKKKIQLTKEMEFSPGSDKAEEKADDEDLMTEE